MKLFFTYLLTIISLHALAQNSDVTDESQKGFKSWANLGYGIYNSSSKHNTLTEINSGLNFLIQQKHYFGIHSNLGFSKNFFFSPNQIFFQTIKYVNYGQREKLRKNLYLTPSVGIGLAKYSITRFYSENASDESSFIRDLFFDATGKTIYANYHEQSVCFPVRMELSFVGRGAGLALGFDMIIMKYPSIGATLDFQFGKIRNKY